MSTFLVCLYILSIYFAISFILFTTMLSFLCREYRNCHFFTGFSMLVLLPDLHYNYSTFIKIYFLSSGIQRG